MGNTRSSKAKTPAQSAVETRYLVMPNHANPYGTAFGGVIMAWIDMVASMAARKHAGKEVVTVNLDTLSFKEPVHIGDQIILKACVNYVGRTSIEVGVQVTRENPDTGVKTLTTTAHLTFVALDKNKQPATIVPLEPETADEKRRYANAQLRVKARKELLRKMK